MIYLDYGATTPVRPEVREEMERYFAAEFANPHSVHGDGERARAAVETAREQIARCLGAKPKQIIFTSGGTEANNLAILGLARSAKYKRKHLVTSAIEHKSILGPMHALSKSGFTVDLLPLELTGLIKLPVLEQTVREDTLLVSVAHGNSEIGTIQPIEALAKLAKGKGALFHCDAVQSFGKIPVEVPKLGVDLISISGHKIYGPKGIGVLYVGPGVKLEPLMYGGGQERDLRPGTLNVSGIMGMAKAVELAVQEAAGENSRLRELRERLFATLIKIEGLYLNGEAQSRLPNNLNLGISGLDGQVIVAELAKRDIAVSPGSACGAMGPSHVLAAIHPETDRAYEGFRITLGKYTSQQDILAFVANLTEVINDLRTRYVSP
ncbi:MAG TPA: cysteine desulfurase family protein [Verrucomicrobiae bacterium]|nr:cysteine desulfurase family protein [Verrucomicrobiae bacterium]